MANRSRKKSRVNGDPFWLTEALVESVTEKVARRWSRSALKVYVTEMVQVGWEDTTPTEQELLLVIGKAHAGLIERGKGTTENNRAVSVAFYESVLRDRDADMKDKLKAQERLDKILGLEDIPVDAKAGLLNRARQIVVAVAEIDATIGAPPSAPSEGKRTG